VNGLIESQKWPVGFGPSGEVVVRDQGVEVCDGRLVYPLPFGCLSARYAFGLGDGLCRG